MGECKRGSGLEVGRSRMRERERERERERGRERAGLRAIEAGMRERY